MKNNSFSGTLTLLILLITSTYCSGQSSSGEHDPAIETESSFFYVTYYGSRYNKITRRQELVIEGVMLANHLLKVMPRLREPELYSSKNIRRYHKQLEVVRQNGKGRLSIRVDRKKFNVSYPKGLKRGIIVECSEFDQWDFRVMDIPAPPPIIEKRIYHLNIYYIKYHPLDFNGYVKKT